MQSSQSTPKEVKYAQYLIYAASLLFLVLETITELQANRVFYVPFAPIVVCALGFFVGRSIGQLHPGTRTFVIVLASLSLLLSVGSAVLLGLGVFLPISGNTFPPVYSYVSEGLYAVIDGLLLYYLTRPHVREVFRKPPTALSQPKVSQAREDGTQDEA